MAATTKVLVIDDDQDFRASVKALLETKGYAIIEAGSGKEGLRKVLEQKPDVILLDIMMDNCTDGYSVNQAIKYQDGYEPFRAIPIIMVSAIEETPDERFPMSAEVEMIRPDNYLTKPLDFSRLLEVLERTIARSRPTAAGDERLAG